MTIPQSGEIAFIAGSSVSQKARMRARMSVARWPGRIPAGSQSDEPVMSIDLLPSFARLLGVELPKDKPIDGKSVLPILMAEAGAVTPHEALFFWAGSELQAVRMGRWKLHFAHPYITVHSEPGRGGKPSNFENMKPNPITQSGIEGIATRHGYRIEQQEMALYDLSVDPGESRNVLAEHSEVVAKMAALAQPMREALGDSLTQTVGREIRPAAVDESP
jgi:arylsulfatase